MSNIVFQNDNYICEVFFHAYIMYKLSENVNKTVKTSSKFSVNHSIIGKLKSR